jgi:hypothetical protein
VRLAEAISPILQYLNDTGRFTQYDLPNTLFPDPYTEQVYVVLPEFRYADERSPGVSLLADRYGANAYGPIKFTAEPAGPSWSSGPLCFLTAECEHDARTEALELQVARILYELEQIPYAGCWHRRHFVPPLVKPR